ncbi:MAG: discoidin domain-containing protein [Verrucomicrobia bacterium]|nr:MAG: discoidin domain-containing protein [Verrucomicrobiota bacterium]
MMLRTTAAERSPTGPNPRRGRSWRHCIVGLAWCFLLLPPGRAAEANRSSPNPSAAAANPPLVPERIVFNWHNFLSGCSTWNFSDWARWIRDARALDYNAVMVHAYGNNPMFQFEFNGRLKPVGYLSTTVRGRDWSTMHVNDVRRLWGGEVFDGPVFGAKAAMVPEAKRVEAARALMRRVFAEARRQGMKVYFALDVDTVSANPQELIRSLPQRARFPVKAGGPQGGRFWLANPDTPEGFAYYRAQAAALVKAYPDVGCLVVWFRIGLTPWMEFAAGEMPAEWQAEFAAATAQDPGLARAWRAPNLFALNRVTRAFRRALDELGRPDIELGLGTWGFSFLPAADRFFPPEVKFIGLDYAILHGRPILLDEGARETLRAVGARRELIPVMWAQHDDGAYVGRPYRPIPRFLDRLRAVNAGGFGIIHWTTRPLELFFRSLSEQVHAATANRPLAETCAAAAREWFGPAAATELAAYLEAWMREAPMFGRETSDWFIDRPLTNVAAVVAGCRQRLAMLARVEPASLTPEARERLAWFRGLEEFIAGFHETQDRYQQALAAYGRGDLEEARRLMAACRPEEVIRQFAVFSSRGGITRGEQGLVVSLNLRWLPHLLRLRQALGMEPVRINFRPTQHDPLAQSPGRFTFHVGPARDFWECRGERETGLPVVQVPAASGLRLPEDAPPVWAEVGRDGVRLDRPLKLTLAPNLGRDLGSVRADHLVAGEHRLSLLFLSPPTNREARTAVRMACAPATAAEVLEFAPVTARRLRLRCRGNSENDWNSLCELRVNGRPAAGLIAEATASGAVEGYPAAHAADGNPATRWAINGRDHWLAFQFKQPVKLRQLAFDWYQGDRRKMDFSLEVSDDGEHWRPLAGRPADARASGTTGRLAWTTRLGEPARLRLWQTTATLDAAGRLELTVTPEEGTPVLAGVILEPPGL